MCFVVISGLFSLVLFVFTGAAVLKAWPADDAVTQATCSIKIKIKIKIQGQHFYLI